LVWVGLANNAVKPFIIQQRQIIRVTLSKQNLVGLTSNNFIQLNVLPFESLYKKIAILFIIKNINSWIELENRCNKKELRAYDVKQKFMKKAFGQRFVDYLGPTFFNSMPLYIKKKVSCNSRDFLTHKYGKYVSNWLMDSLE
jgi:hypothetical protein